MIPRSQFKFVKCLFHSVSKPVFDPANRNGQLLGRFPKGKVSLLVISDRNIIKSSVILKDNKNLSGSDSGVDSLKKKVSSPSSEDESTKADPESILGSKSGADTLNKKAFSSSSEDEPIEEIFKKDAKATAVSLAKELASKLSSKVGSSDSEIRVTDLLKDKEKSKDPTNATKKSAAKRQKASLPRVDLSASSVERNFITPVRAMSDFLLKPADLEGLRPSKRRSPFENEPPIIVYWRKDVEAKAIEKWGSLEILEKEKLQRELERKYYEQTIFATKRRMRDYRRDVRSQADLLMAQTSGLSSSSGRVVLTAVVINGTNFIFKLCAWRYTGSHSMFSETIHSLADTINQLILAYGIHKSVQRANQYHPYGYTHMKYVASLISGVGIFCVGTGLSLYHGITGLMNPQPMESFFWAYFVLAGSFVSEGATSLVAFNSIKKGARDHGMSFTEYVLRGKDPSVNVVLLEDLAAVAGVMVAGVCMGLSSYYDSVIPDAIGSLLVGGILGGVASFIIYTNVAALLGRSIPEEYLNRINTELESDVMIRAIYDVKGIDIGNSLIRYKAELDFDGRQLTRSYLDKQDLNALLEEVQNFNDIDQLESFMIKHSENIVDMMGGEIDRIEMKLRAKFPDIRHCDLEIL